MNRELTLRTLGSGTVAWIKQDLPRSGRYAAMSFGITWIINFALITTKGASWGNLIGAATEGTEVSGSVYLGIVSAALTALAVYGVERGWKDLRSSFLALPRAIGRMFREHGVRMWSIVFWGGAMSLLASGAIDPTISAALGIGFLALAPTAVTGLLGKLLTKVWLNLIGFFAPKKKPKEAGLGGRLVGTTGWIVGFLVATQATETAFQLIAAGVLAGLSYFVLLNASTRTASAAGFVLMGFAFWLAGDAVAQAFQGCCGEDHHHALEPGMQAVGLSTIAGAAGAAGGVIGAGVGSVLAAHPQDPSGWTDPGDRPPGGPRVTTDPIPDGPTRTTTITLEGDAAREALEAWRQANADGGAADIPIPEGEQWDISVSNAEGETIREGHAGTRGRVTNIGAIAEGEDGSIVISVDVTAYTPVAPAAVAAPDTTSPAGGDASDAPPPPSPDDAPPEAPTPEAETAAPEPAPEPEPPPPPPVPDEADEDDEPDETPDSGIPDGSDPDAFADWTTRVATGTLPDEDVAAAGALIRGDTDAVTLSGRVLGRWAPLLAKTEPRPDGVAVKAPTGDRIVIRVRDGEVQVRHEASLFSVIASGVSEAAGKVGVDLPDIEDLIENVKGPMASLNRSLAATGRQVESIVRNDDGSLTLVTGPAE